MKTQLVDLLNIFMILALLIPLETLAWKRLQHTTPYNLPEAITTTCSMVIIEVLIYPDIGGFAWVAIKNDGASS